MYAESRYQVPAGLIKAILKEASGSGIWKAVCDRLFPLSGYDYKRCQVSTKLGLEPTNAKAWVNGWGMKCPWFLGPAATLKYKLIYD